MKFFIKLILILFLPYWVVAQTYPDYYGAGQYQGITVTSSNEDTGTAKNLALNQSASQSSDSIATNFLPSYANDGNINTMNHTKTPNQVNADTSDIRNLALRKPISQFGLYPNGFPATHANDGDLSTMNHTIDPGNWSDYDIFNVENLALNKLATQSSDYDTVYPASNANDGSTETINHTLNELHAWWEVDLGELSGIKSIEILNRTDCCSDNLDSFYVFVSEVPFTSTDPDITAAQAAVTSFPIDTVLSVHNITVEQMGRYVRIQLANTNSLHLREVKVLGLPNNTAWMEVDLGEVSNITNINLHNRSNCCWGRLYNSYVFISDTPFTSNNVDSIQVQAGIGSHYIGTADRYLNEVEVNRTGRYVRVQLTDPTEPLHLMEIEVLGTPKVNSWWQVDLGTACDITDIEVLNRTNCCSERLDNFYLFVSDNPFVSEDLNKTINKANVSSYFTADALDVNTIPVNRTGRFVRIQLDSQAPLHMTEVRVFGTPKENTAINTVNGNGTLPNLADASRFLSQATLGYNYEEIEKVSEMGIDAWLDEQFSLPYSSYEETYREIYDRAVSLTFNAPSRKKREYLSYTFFQKLSEDSDYLRHKTANALSQILVISSDDATLEDQGIGLSNYYDILYQGAYGNFRDILSKVSIHTAMGTYLSSFRNSKADFGLLTFPDENYAREVMQLFTIGLLELNNDGSLKLDSNGEPIPTYTNEDIVELANVFTGMATGKRTSDITPSFGLTLANAGQIDFAFPMGMYEDEHDKQEKTMIDGTILPAGQDGLTDVEGALDVLFNHPNVGPFIGLRLIQQFVKSNPSPAYINRVANAFNDNGAGVRGDLGAVVKAVLTDPEARTCTASADVKSGKLKQPTERLTNLFLAFDITSPSGKLWFKDQIYAGMLEQEFLGSPSVFNFFSPFYAETEYVEPNDMVSPEFHIFNSTSSIYYLNIIENTIKNYPFDNYTESNSGRAAMDDNPADKPSLDFSDEIHIMDSEGIDALLDRLDILLCRGQLTIETRNSIKNGIIQYQANIPDYDSQQAVKDVLYFIMISPDYLIQE